MKATGVNPGHLYFVDPNGHGRNANVEKHLERMPDVIQRTCILLIGMDMAKIEMLQNMNESHRG